MKSSVSFKNHEANPPPKEEQWNICISFLSTATSSVLRIIWQQILRDSVLHKELLINLKIRGMAAPADIMYLCWLTLKPAFRYRKNVQTIKKADPERANYYDK